MLGLVIVSSAGYWGRPMTNPIRKLIEIEDAHTDGHIIMIAIYLTIKVSLIVRLAVVSA